jgi:hypothetical protein
VFNLEKHLDFAEIKKHSVDVEFKTLKPSETKEIDESQTSTSEHFDFELQPPPWCLMPLSVLRG